MRFLILILLSIFSCATPPIETSSIISKPYDESVLVISSKHIAFNSFVDKFQKIDLPMSLKVNGPHWIDFSAGKDIKKVISRDLVRRYFYDNSDQKLKSSSIDQFYYGNTFLFSEDLIGISFYGNSKESNGIDGYHLHLFNGKGDLKDVLLIAGSRGLADVDLQIEAKISKKEIILNRIELDQNKITDLNKFEGKQKMITYRILNEGSFQKVNETEFKSVWLSQKEDNGFRIQVIE